MSDNPAPKHAFEVKISIGANEQEYVLRALDEIRETIVRSGVEHAMSGGWDGSWHIDASRRDISPEDYRKELAEWSDR